MAWIFQVFAILVVIIVVIFQEELRQVFERLAVWGLRRPGGKAAASADPTDILVNCLTDLARPRQRAGGRPKPAVVWHLQAASARRDRLTIPHEGILDLTSHDGAMVIGT
jgi:hypothetical protein